MKFYNFFPPSSDLDTTLHSVSGDQTVLALAEEQGQDGENNETVAESQSGMIK